MGRRRGIMVTTQTKRVLLLALSTAGSWARQPSGVPTYSDDG